MAWETRNKRRYYYKSQREGNKVRKIYLGRGDAGRTAELALECRRDQRRAVRDWLRDAATKFAELDKIDAELTVGLAAILFAKCAICLDARLARRISRKQGAMVMQEIAREIPLSAEDQAMWQHLREQASRGDREIAAAFLPFLDEHPQLTDRLGDLSKLALNKWLILVAGRDEVGKRTIHTKVLGLVSSLRRDAEDPLERLLTQRVGLLWLQAHYIDLQLELAVSRTHEEQDFLAKRQVATEHAYTGAIQSLQEYQTRADASPCRPARKRVPR